MEKKLVLLFIILLFLPFVFSNTLTGYSVTNNANITNVVSWYGQLKDANDAGVPYELCSFYLQDLDTNEVVYRATDQYTNSSGILYLEFRIPSKLPYNPDPPNSGWLNEIHPHRILSFCGDANTLTDFNVLPNSKSFANAGANSFEFITNPDVTDTFFIWGTIIAVFAVFGFLIYIVYRVARG